VLSEALAGKAYELSCACCYALSSAFQLTTEITKTRVERIKRPKRRGSKDDETFPKECRRSGTRVSKDQKTTELC